MRRVVEPELLDSDAGTPEEVAQSLGDLRAINRRFGGIRTLRKLVERVAAVTGTDSLSLLDVGAGSGDVPRGVAEQLRGRGVRVAVTLCDRAATHLPTNTSAAQADDIFGTTARLKPCPSEIVANKNAARRVVGDALALPFQNDTFDVVSCSLFLHHLEPAEIDRFAREAMRVARRALVINDLRRGWMHFFFVRIGTALFKSRITKHDGRVSVRRSYTPAEARAMLRAAGVRRVEVRRRYLFRMAVVAWK